LDFAVIRCTRLSEAATRFQYATICRHEKEIAVSNAPENRPVVARPASAIVLLRDTDGDGVEVFMVRRHVQSEFVPDVFVFPGGSVKPEDRETELAPGVCAPGEPGPTVLGSGLRAAALRECFEEAGVLLARQAGEGGVAGEAGMRARQASPLQAPPVGPGDVARFADYRAGLQNRTITLRAIAEAERLVLGTDALLHWAHWITPEAMPKRFDTHFFLAAMPEGQEAAHDQLETTDSAWVTPEAALRDFEAGSFPLVFATVHQLQALTSISSIQVAHERFAGTTPRTIMPHIVVRDGASVIAMPGEE